MRQNIVICALLVLATFILYRQVVTFEFVNHDDPQYVYLNPHVHTGLTFQNIQWAFTEPHAANWHALTWLSLMLDAHITRGLGNDPTHAAAVYHATNLLLHIANVLLIFAVINMMTRAPWRSAVVAALFALHPIHIESVAWISERKDVLSTLFWWLTIWAYVHYTRTRSITWYVTTAALLILGLLAKPMLVTLPCVLLLLDIWPLQRLKVPLINFGPYPPHSALATWRRAIFEKLPLLAIIAAAVALTLHVQSQAGATHVSFDADLSMRFANAVIAYGKYLGKLFWPFALAVFYPHPAAVGARTIDPFAVGLAIIILALVTVTLINVAHLSRRGYPLIGWLWFLGTMVPVLGIIQVGDQAMADRYAYVTFPGLYILLVWSASDLLRHFRAPRLVAPLLTAVILIALAARSGDQLPHWRNSEALFQHALAVTTDNCPANFVLAVTYIEKSFDETGQTRIQLLHRSMDHARAAVDIDPSHFKSLIQWGSALYQLGHDAQAIEKLHQATVVSHNNPHAVEALVCNLFLLNRYPDAIQAAGSHRAAVRIIENAMTTFWSDEPQLSNNLEQLKNTRSHVPTEKL